MVYATLKSTFWIKQASMELITICKSMIIRIKVLINSIWKPGHITLLPPTIPITYNKRKRSIAQGERKFQVHLPHLVAK